MPADQYPRELQDVTTDENYEVKRLHILGGWLVFIRDTQFNLTTTEVVNDPNHEWILET